MVLFLSSALSASLTLQYKHGDQEKNLEIDRERPCSSIMPVTRNSGNDKPSTVPLKRKRDIADYSGTGSDSEKENDTESALRSEQAKTTKASKATSKSKSLPGAKPKSKSKSDASTTTTSSKDAKKLYTITLKAIDKRIADLDKKINILLDRNPNSDAITTETSARSLLPHIPIVTKLASMDSKLAFNLLLSMADASHTDCDSTIKMCGTCCDDTGDIFGMLDKLLLKQIESMLEMEPVTGAGTLTEVPKRWTEADAPESERRNKRQRKALYKRKVGLENERRLAKRMRRETTDRWAAAALSDLVEERDHLDAYGVGGYLLESIARLEELCK